MSNTLKALLVLLVLAVVGYFVINNHYKTNTPSSENTDVVIHDTFAYFCSEDNSVITTIFGDNETLKLVMGDISYTLSQTMSASGARYANFDESVVFWNKGVEGTVEINGETLYQNCILVEEDNLPNEPVPTIVDESLVDIDWVWTETLYSDDSVVTPNTLGAFVARFGTDGHFSSQTDCNNIMGSYQIDAEKRLSFGPLASTLMACTDSQEDLYGTMMSQVQSYLITEDGKLALVLAYDSGSMIFEKTTE